MKSRSSQIRAAGTSSQDKSCNMDKKEGRSKLFANKEFAPRDSLLTDLLRITHIQTIYNIFVAMFIVLFLSITVHDYIEKGEVRFGLETVKYGFGKLSDAFRVWTLMAISTCLLYVGFAAWTRLRLYFSEKRIVASTLATDNDEHRPSLTSRLPLLPALPAAILDYGFLAAFVVNQALFIFLPANFLVRENLPPASSLMLLMEQVRMLMKTHAFVRSNVPRVLGARRPGGRAGPGFRSFLYFMLAPTLIYRDEYPRTSRIRWSRVAQSFAEVAVAILYAAFLFERFVIPPFERFGRRIFEPRVALPTLLSMTLPAICIYLFGFFCILHSWQNAMAELLGFADKLFYKDWWNSTSYNEYYRSWNVIVQDWLYHYVYRDVYERSRSRLASVLAVFFASALFHEYIMALALRFFYPVMMLLFGGLGLLLLFVTTNHSQVTGNVFMWFGLFTGNAILFTLYSMEYYARLHCPPHSDRLFDFFFPRSWTCRETENNV